MEKEEMDLQEPDNFVAPGEGASDPIDVPISPAEQTSAPVESRDDFVQSVSDKLSTGVSLTEQQDQRLHQLLDAADSEEITQLLVKYGLEDVQQLDAEKLLSGAYDAVTSDDTVMDVITKAENLASLAVSEVKDALMNTDLWSQIIQTATHLLSESPTLRNKVVTGVTSAITDWISGYMVNYLTGQSGHEVIPESLQILITIIANVMPEDTWKDWVDATVLVASAIEPFTSGGISILSALAGVVNGTGWLTSHGGPYNVSSEIVNGIPYLMVDIGDMTVAFATQPNLKYPMIAAYAQRTLPRAVNKVFKWLPGSVSSAVKLIASAIDKPDRRGYLREYLNNQSTYLEKLLDAAGLSKYKDYTVNQMYQQLVSAVYDYYSTLNRRASETTPDVGSPTESLPLSPQPVEVPAPDEVPAQIPPTESTKSFRLSDLPSPEQRRPKTSRDMSAAALYPWGDEY